MHGLSHLDSQVLKLKQEGGHGGSALPENRKCKGYQQDARLEFPTIAVPSFDFEKNIRGVSGEELHAV